MKSSCLAFIALLLVIPEANAATIDKCVIKGRVTYSNISSVCAAAEKKIILEKVDPYRLDLGEPKVMGAAAHAYLRGMPLTIPRYETNRSDDLYGDPLPLVVPDLSRPEYQGNNPSGYHGRTEILNNPRILSRR